MRKRRSKYTTVLNVLLCLWTVGVLYGSLAPGDDLPSAGWFDWIPHFDKVVHWGFYFGETLLLLLRFNPQGWRRGAVVIGVILCSGGIELVQGALGYRSKDLIDFAANSCGTLCGVLITPLINNLIKKRLQMPK